MKFEKLLVSDSSYADSPSSDSELNLKELERLRSLGRREKESLARGEKAHVRGRHFYLNEEEEVKLVITLASWPDVRTQPLFRQISTLVFVQLFIYFLLYRNHCCLLGVNHKE
jgi:hypothetical protein